jgi:hypothetical protein
VEACPDETAGRPAREKLQAEQAGLCIHAIITLVGGTVENVVQRFPVP